MNRNDNTTKAIGECGKSLVVQLFRANGYMVTKPDVDPNSFIDFYAYRDKQFLKVFVRTDTRINITENIVVERFMHRQNSIEIGWLFQGQADVLCYLDACSGDVYFFDWQALKKYVVMHCKARPFRNSYDVESIGDAYIVPLKRVLKEPDVFISRAKVDITPMYQFRFKRPAPF